MSDRLAISATFSVLMMSVYVLFGAQAPRGAATPHELRAPASLSAPASITGQGQIFR